MDMQFSFCNEDELAHAQSKQTVDVQIGNVPRLQEEAGQSKQIVKYQSQQNLAPKTQLQRFVAPTIKNKFKRPPKKPITNINKDSPPKQQRVTSLPKLNFSDLLSKAPKPRNLPPKPSFHISQEFPPKELESLTTVANQGMTLPQNDHYKDIETSKILINDDSSRNIKSPQIIQTTDNSIYQSFPDFNLKPDIIQFNKFDSSYMINQSIDSINRDCTRKTRQNSDLHEELKIKDENQIPAKIFFTDPSSLQSLTKNGSSKLTLRRTKSSKNNSIHLVDTDAVQTCRVEKQPKTLKKSASFAKKNIEVKKLIQLIEQKDEKPKRHIPKAVQPQQHKISLKDSKAKKIDLIDKNLEKQIQMERQFKDEEFKRQQEQFETLEKKLEQEYQDLSTLQKLQNNMNKIHNLKKERYQEQLEKKLGEDLYTQEKMEAQLKIAIKYRNHILKLRAIKILKVNSQCQITKKILEQACIKFRREKLLNKLFGTLSFYAHVYIPEQKQLNVAAKQHNIMRKIKVFNVLKIYRREKKKKRIRLKQARCHLDQLWKTKIFNEFINNAANRQIEKQQKFMAGEHRKITIRKKVFIALKVFREYHQNEKQMMIRVKNYKNEKRMKCAFEVLYGYCLEQQRKTRINWMKNDFAQAKVEPNIKMSVFIALQKFAIKQKQNRKAEQFLNKQVQKRSFRWFVQGINIKRNYGTQKRISRQIYEQKLLSQVFQSILYAKQLNNQEIKLIKSHIQKYRLQSQFILFSKVCKQIKIEKPIQHPMQLLCCKFMLETTFEKIMGKMWQKYPDEKIERCKEVFQGKVELELPNYLTLAQNKYREFFVKVNKYLLEDIQRKAFKLLCRNLQKMKMFRKNKKIRYKKRIFYGFIRAIKGQYLLQKYLQRADKVRQVQSYREVMDALKWYMYNKKIKEDKYCQILKKRKLRIEFKCMRAWQRRFLKQTKRNYLDEMAVKYQKFRMYNKYLPVWLRRLKTNLKKKHLVEVIAPKVEKRVAANIYFKAWLLLFKKNQYLNDQMQSIECYQKNEQLQVTFKALKQYAQTKRMKMIKENVAYQQYVYHLGKRVIKRLINYTQHRYDKIQFYHNLSNDKIQKDAKKVIRELRIYKNYKKNQRINDCILTKEVEKVFIKSKLRQWMKILERRQALKFVEASLDLIRLRKALSLLKSFTDSQDQLTKKISMTKSFHLKNQYFKSLKKFMIKSQKLKQLKFNIHQNYYKRWRRAFMRRQRNFKMFDWTIIALKQLMVKQYFNQLKSYSRYKVLKRNSPKIYTDTLLSKHFQILLNFVQKRQNCKHIQQFLNTKRNQKIMRYSLKIWKFKFEQNLTLNNKFQVYQEHRLQTIFTALKQYAIIKQNKNLKFNNVDIDGFKKKYGLKRFISQIQKVNEIEQKVIIAECFYNQYKYNYSMRAWIDYYRTNQQQIKKISAVKQLRKSYIKSNALSVWMTKCQKSLNKIQSKNKIIHLTWKQELRRSIKIWSSQSLELRNLLERLGHFNNYKSLKLQQQGFEALISNIISRQTKRQRLDDISGFYNKKLQHQALQVMKWYLQERRDKRDMSSIAYAQQAQVIIQRSFTILKYICEQKKVLRQVSLEFKKRQIERYCPEVLSKLRINLMLKQRMVESSFQANQFRIYKLYEKVFKSLYNRSLQEQIKQHNNFKAQQFKIAYLERNYFKKLFEYKCDRQLLRQKRQMLYQVIETIDHHNRLQQAFDQLFQNLIDQSDNMSFALHILKMNKLKRIFKTLQWNKNQELQYKSTFEIIQNKIQMQLKVKMFYKWRTKKVQQNLVSSYDRKRQLNIVQKVFCVLQEILVNQKRVKFIQNKKKDQTIEKIFNKLRSNVLNKAIKADKLEFSKQYYQDKLKRNSLITLKKKADLKFYQSKIVIKLNKKLLFESFSLWYNKGQLLRLQRQLLTSIIQRKRTLMLQINFKRWRKGTYLMKMCQVIYQNFELSRYEKPEFQLEIVRVGFDSWKNYITIKKLYKQKVKEFRQKQNEQKLENILRFWRQTIRDKLLSSRLAKILKPSISQAFSDIQQYSIKEQQLQELEQEVTQERLLQLKNRYLYAWTKVYNKRQKLNYFMYQKDLFTSKKAFMSLKENLIKSQENKIVQVKILNHFEKKQPEVLQMFSKAFMSMNAEYKKLEAHSISLDLLSYSDENTVNVCQTVLAKYVFDKWRLAIPILRKKNEQNQKAQEFLLFNSQHKVFTSWKKKIQTKVKERVLIQFSTDLFNENILKRCFEQLINYKTQRQNKKKLREIGDELQQIKKVQTIHQIILNWYDLTVEQIRDEKRYDGVVEQFQAMQTQKKYPKVFMAIRMNVQNCKEKRKLVGDMEQYAEQFYHRNLLQRVLSILQKQES